MGHTVFIFLLSPPVSAFLTFGEVMRIRIEFKQGVQEPEAAWSQYTQLPLRKIAGSGICNQYLFHQLPWWVAMDLIYISGARVQGGQNGIIYRWLISHVLNLEYLMYLIYIWWIVNIWYILGFPSLSSSEHVYFYISLTYPTCHLPLYSISSSFLIFCFSYFL